MIVGALAACAACDDKGPPPPAASRSEQVVASGNMPTAAPSVASAAPVVTAPAAPRVLCDKSERTLAKVVPDFVDRAGHDKKARLPLDDKHLIWINFFAAWCGPCKEEIPRIQRFSQRLVKDGVPVEVAFVSIDDDLRQLQGFYAAQPATGVKSSYWLPDGPTRNGFLSALRMKTSPELPEHVIVDGKGESKCFIDGAIEDKDYAELLSALK